MDAIKKFFWDNNEPAALNLLVLSAFFAMFSLPGGRLLTILAFIFWIVMLVRSRSWPGIPGVGWLVFAYTAWITLALWWGPVEQINSSQLYRHLFWLNIPLVFAFLTTTERRVRMIMALAAGATVQSIRTIVDTGRSLVSMIAADVPFRSDLFMEQFVYHRALGGPDVVGKLIPEGDMQSAQALAAGLFLSIGAYQLAAPKTTGRRWALAASFLIAFAMLLTFKRLALTGVVAAALIFAVGWLFRRAPVPVAFAKASLVLSGLFFAAATFWLGAPAGWPEKIEQAAQSGGRICMWTQVTPALVKEYPFGMGYKALTPEKMQSVARHVEKDREHVHSNPLQALIDGGWPGLFLFVWLIIEHFRNHTRYIRNLDNDQKDGVTARALALASFTLVLAGFLEYQFGAGQIALLYGLLMGTAAAGAQRVQSLSVRG